MNKTRTGGMTAIAVLNLVFGAILALTNLWVMMGLHAVMSRSFAGAEATAAAMTRLGMSLYYVVCGAVAIVAGVGVLKVAPWGRILSLAYAGLIIPGYVIDIFLPTIGESSDGGLVLGAKIIGSIIGSVFWMIYPVILLIVFQKPSWKEAFKPKSGVHDHNVNFCPECGAKVNSEDSFCQNCGRSLKDASIPQRRGENDVLPDM